MAAPAATCIADSLETKPFDLQKLYRWSLLLSVASCNPVMVTSFLSNTGSSYALHDLLRTQAANKISSTQGTVCTQLKHEADHSSKSSSAQPRLLGQVVPLTQCSAQTVTSAHYVQSTEPLQQSAVAFVAASSAEEPSFQGSSSSDSRSSSSRTQKQARDHHVFMAGAMSGVVEGLSIQPLELLKTRFQINTGAPLRLLPTIREVFREGGLLQFYRGALPEITGLIPRATAALSTLEFSQRTFKSLNGGELSLAGAYVSGGLSGVTEGLAFQPFQVVKVRLMAKEHLGRYKNSWDCLRQILRTEGPLALLTGLGPTMWRNTIWNSIYYGTVFELDKHLPTLQDPIANAVKTIVVGTGVGMFATCFNAPFDVVKSRFQSQLPHEAKYRYTLPSLVTIYREEGARALYKGFLPKAIRLGVGQTLGLSVFQACLKASAALSD